MVQEIPSGKLTWHWNKLFEDVFPIWKWDFPLPSIVLPEGIKKCWVKQGKDGWLINLPETLVVW